MSRGKTTPPGAFAYEQPKPRGAASPPEMQHGRTPPEISTAVRSLLAAGQAEVEGAPGDRRGNTESTSQPSGGGAKAARTPRDPDSVSITQTIAAAVAPGHERSVVPGEGRASIPGGPDDSASPVEKRTLGAAEFHEASGGTVAVGRGEAPGKEARAGQGVTVSISCAAAATITVSRKTFVAGAAREPRGLGNTEFHGERLVEISVGRGRDRGGGGGGGKGSEVRDAAPDIGGPVLGGQSDLPSTLQVPDSRREQVEHGNLWRTVGGTITSGVRPRRVCQSNEPPSAAAFFSSDAHQHGSDLSPGEDNDIPAAFEGLSTATAGRTRPRKAPAGSNGMTSSRAPRNGRPSAAVVDSRLPGERREDSRALDTQPPFALEGPVRTVGSGTFAASGAGDTGGSVGAAERAVATAATPFRATHATEAAGAQKSAHGQEVALSSRGRDTPGGSAGGTVRETESVRDLAKRFDGNLRRLPVNERPRNAPVKVATSADGPAQKRSTPAEPAGVPAGVDSSAGVGSVVPPSRVPLRISAGFSTGVSVMVSGGDNKKTQAFSYEGADESVATGSTRSLSGVATSDKSPTARARAAAYADADGGPYSADSLGSPEPPAGANPKIPTSNAIHGHTAPPGGSVGNPPPLSSFSAASNNLTPPPPRDGTVETRVEGLITVESSLRRPPIGLTAEIAIAVDGASGATSEASSSMTGEPLGTVSARVSDSTEGGGVDDKRALRSQSPEAHRRSPYSPTKQVREKKEPSGVANNGLDGTGRTRAVVATALDSSATDHRPPSTATVAAVTGDAGSSAVMAGEERKLTGGQRLGDSPDDESSEDGEFNPSVKTDHFGFFITSERRGQELPQKVAKARRLKECKRSDKWIEMMAHFDEWRRGRKAKRFRKRVRKGVPDCVRGKVWQMMAGSLTMMEKDPNRYADLVASDLPVEGPIEEDIPRTMYDHEMFCHKARVDGRAMLRRVLTAYGRYDREVQYCQGINYICALFLLYMPEENAFWLLVATMSREQAPLRDLFLPGMVKAQEFQYVVDSLTDKYCKDLSAQILAYNLTPAMYATQWFLTVFTQRFPYDFVTRVWDIFLLEDWKVFYRVCLALFKTVEERAVKLDLENMNLLLRNMPPKVDTEQILTTAANIPLKHRHIEKRKAQFYKSTRK